MPIMVIAKKSCRVMIEPPEKGAGDRAIGRDGSVPAADFFVRKIPERAKIIFPDQPSLPWRQKRPVEQLDVNPGRPARPRRHWLSACGRLFLDRSMPVGREFHMSSVSREGGNKGESKGANQRTSLMSVGMSEKCQKRSQAERIDLAH